MKFFDSLSFVLSPSIAGGSILTEQKYMFLYNGHRGNNLNLGQHLNHNTCRYLLNKTHVYSES